MIYILCHQYIESVEEKTIDIPAWSELINFLYSKSSQNVNNTKGHPKKNVGCSYPTGKLQVKNNSTQKYY